jgi:hypothetical protein
MKVGRGEVEAVENTLQVISWGGRKGDGAGKEKDGRGDGELIS